MKIFEFGSVFDENANQSERFGFVACGLAKEPTLLNSAKPNEIDFLSFALAIKNIIGDITLQSSSEISYLSEFEQAKIYKNGLEIGYIGRVDIRLESKLDLPKTYLCEVDFEKMKFNEAIVKAYSKFPAVSRDLSLIIPKNMQFKAIKECIQSLKIERLQEFLPVDIYRDDKLGDNVSLSIKFSFQDLEKTLEDEEVVIMMDKILNALKQNLNIGLR